MQLPDARADLQIPCNSLILIKQTRSSRVARATWCQNASPVKHEQDAPPSHQQDLTSSLGVRRPSCSCSKSASVPGSALAPAPAPELVPAAVAAVAGAGGGSEVGEGEGAAAAMSEDKQTRVGATAATATPAPARGAVQLEALHRPSNTREVALGVVVRHVRGPGFARLQRAGM